MARSQKQSKSVRIAWAAWSACLLFALVATSLFFYQTAYADAGGWPTNTPTMTSTATQTPTYTPPPTLTPIITPTNLIGDTPQPPVSTPKTIPTGTLLSEAELLGTLEANTQPPTGEEENPRPAFWWYILILFGVSAAVVVIVLLGLLRQSKKQPVAPEEEETPPE